MKTLSRLCYCSSAKGARAAVKALEAAGYAARADADGRIYVDSPTDTAFSVANEAIRLTTKGTK